MVYFHPQPQAKFWIVWSPQGHTPPTAKHPTEETARNEAIRLARANPGSQFFWLSADGLAQKSDVDLIRFEAPHVQSVHPFGSSIHRVVGA